MTVNVRLYSMTTEFDRSVITKEMKKRQVNRRAKQVAASFKNSAKFYQGQANINRPPRG